MSRVAKRAITRTDKQIVREDVEYLLKNGTQDELELVKRALHTSIDHADLKKHGFKIKQHGSGFTIIPPKKPTRAARGMIEFLAEERKQLATRLFGSNPPKPPIQFAEPIPLLNQAKAIEKFLTSLEGDELNRSFPFLDNTGDVGVSAMIEIGGFAFCDVRRLGRSHPKHRSNVHVTFMAKTSEKAVLTIDFTKFSVGLCARWISSQGDGSIKATASMDPGRFELEVGLLSARNSSSYKDFGGAMFTNPVFDHFHNAVDFAGDIPDFAKAPMMHWAAVFLGRELRNLFTSAITNCLALSPRAVLPQEEEPSPRAVAC